MTHSAQSPSIYWLTQNDAYLDERAEGIVQGGSTSATHSLLSELEPGDLVLHFWRGAVHSISVAGEDRWQDDAGRWKLSAFYLQLDTPLRLRDVPRELRGDGSPFSDTGGLRSDEFMALDWAWFQRLVAELPGRFPAEATEELGMQEGARVHHVATPGLWWQQDAA